MLHWTYKLSVLAIVALGLASALAKGGGIGFFW